MSATLARSKLSQAFQSCRAAFTAVALFSAVVNLLMLTGPLYMAQIYDRVLTSRSIETLIALSALAGGLLLILAVMDLIRSRILVRIGLRIDAKLGRRIFTALFTETIEAQPAAAGTQSLRDLQTLRQFLEGQGLFALLDAPWAPVFLAVTFLFHPVLGFVALAGMVLLFLLTGLTEMFTARTLRESGAHAIGAGTLAERALANAEAVRAMGLLPGLLRRWLGQHTASKTLQALASDRAGLLAAASRAIRMGLQVAMIGAGATLVLAQEITPGVMLAASILMGRALAPVEQAVGAWRSIVAARSAYGRLKQLLQSAPAEEDRLALPPPKGRLSVEGLVVAPPAARRAILRHVSFSLAPGEALGVIGSSASGKSSLARTLVGVWRPPAGSVRLDGAELGHWRSEDLGRYLGYLPQDIELFSGTVAENIGRFDEPMDAQAIVGAAERAGAHEMILALPEGYETEIGARGAALSAGQRQRIGLARALYRDPPLVVLDEPDAHLDAVGDRQLLAAIRGCKARGQTVIVIAHRPNVVEVVDKILVLGEGQVRAFGPRDEILARTTVRPGGNVAPLRAQVAQ